MMAKVNSKEIFETLPVPKAVKAMALPTIFSQIIVLIYNMADTFYLGRTNNPYMVAGASLILPVFNICLSLAGLTGVGGGALISRLLGEEREDEAKKVSAFSFYLSIAETAIFFNINVYIYETDSRIAGSERQYISLCKTVCFLRYRTWRNTHRAFQCDV